MVGDDRLAGREAAGGVGDPELGNRIGVLARRGLALRGRVVLGGRQRLRIGEVRVHFLKAALEGDRRFVDLRRDDDPLQVLASGALALRAGGIVAPNDELVDLAADVPDLERLRPGGDGARGGVDDKRLQVAAVTRDRIVRAVHAPSRIVVVAGRGRLRAQRDLAEGNVLDLLQLRLQAVVDRLALLRAERAARGGVEQLQRAERAADQQQRCDETLDDGEPALVPKRDAASAESRCEPRRSSSRLRLEVVTKRHAVADGDRLASVSRSKVQGHPHVRGLGGAGRVAEDERAPQPGDNRLRGAAAAAVGVALHPAALVARSRSR